MRKTARPVVWEGAGAQSPAPDPIDIWATGPRDAPQRWSCTPLIFVPFVAFCSNGSVLLRCRLKCGGLPTGRYDHGTIDCFCHKVGQKPY